MFFNESKVRSFVIKAQTNPSFQFERIVEELGELAKARAEGNRDEELAELADVLVTVFTYGESAGLLQDLEEAFDLKMDKNLSKKRFTKQGKIKT